MRTVSGLQTRTMRRHAKCRGGHLVIKEDGIERRNKHFQTRRTRYRHSSHQLNVSFDRRSTSQSRTWEARPRADPKDADKRHRQLPEKLSSCRLSQWLQTLMQDPTVLPLPHNSTIRRFWT